MKGSTRNSLQVIKVNIHLKRAGDKWTNRNSQMKMRIIID